MFKYDGWLWRFGDYAIKAFCIGMLWVIGSLPLITMGTATTAAYFTGVKLAENEDVKVLPTFWRSFKQNLVQSTLIFIPFMIVGFSMLYFYTNRLYFDRLGDGVTSLYVVFTLIISILTISVFPILSKFDLKSLQIIKLSFVFCYIHPLVILQVVLIFLVAAFIFIAMPYYAVFAIGLYFILTGRLYFKIFMDVINTRANNVEDSVVME